MSELLILISLQFKLVDIGMEVIYSEKPALITAEIVENYICFIFLQFKFEQLMR